ncbi:MAG: radical SAM protein [Tissierellales bacterium]|nr:radical SAM protein [Tissierellales bacterium]
MTDTKCIAMLLAGGQGSRLKKLTKDNAKPGVMFGGKYRIIDFSLSNCFHSDIFTIGVLIQYKPLILGRYIGNGSSWALDKIDQGIYILPPYADKEGERWYRGTAHAVYQNIEFIDMYDPEYVLVLSGDHIYKMDYSEMLDYAEEKEADLTVSVMEVEWKEANLEVESIYIGGGTPSILSNSLMEDLLSYIKANILDFKEFTLEAGRTDTLTEEKLEIMAKYGVNRISINPQSFNQNTLLNLNRYQDLSELERYFKLCKNKNISINSDLILGLPGENFLDFKNSLDKLIKLNPDNITVHTLSIKNNSGISKEKLMSEEELLDSYNYAKSKLKSQNYQPYYLYRQKDIVENLDNIGYSKSNKESLYNMNMIEESQTVISAGLGSVTKIVGNTGIKRIPYNKSFKDYYHKYIYVNQNKEEYLKKILEEE